MFFFQNKITRKTKQKKHEKQKRTKKYYFRVLTCENAILIFTSDVFLYNDSSSPGLQVELAVHVSPDYTLYLDDISNTLLVGHPGERVKSLLFNNIENSMQFIGKVYDIQNLTLFIRRFIY